MYIFIGCLVGLCLEMLHYHEKNSHTSMAILMCRIFLSIAAVVASSSVTFNNKKRAATVYTMMTILLLPVIVVVIINQNPSIPLAYAVKDHKDNKADNNNQVAHLGGTQDKGNDNNNNNNIVDNNGNAVEATQPTIPTTQLTPSTQSPIPSTPSDASLISVPQGKNCATDLSKRPNAIEYLTYFNCGHINTFTNGTTLREFSLVISENNTIPISDVGSNDPVLFNAWAFNGTVPGPTMRMTEGDHVKITVFNSNSSTHAHSLHMHSIHPGEMDGMMGPAGTIPPGGHFTYDFIASPFGVYPYHCHVEPVTSHINHGLYGMMIIDPKTPRPAAKEMVMMMNGYNLVDDYAPSMSTQSRPPTAAELRANFSDATKSAEGVDNQIYTVNGAAFIYRDHPIDLVTGQDYRIYLVNMLEFDPVNSFHLHGNMFEYYPSGTGTNPSFLTDIVTLGQGDRGIIEFNYNKPGMFMFHAHKNEFTNLGWMGMFNVQDKAALKTNVMALKGQHLTTEHTIKGNDNTFSSSSPFPFLQ
jgi:FtsP/CotA-like multicopper oxidase with cupredoxin domain